jgi:hypothetical protein
MQDSRINGARNKGSSSRPPTLQLKTALEIKREREKDIPVSSCDEISRTK